jgi:hypothetical protein
MLFPRNGKDDAMFSSDWPHLYRERLPKDPMKAPLGYVVDQSIIEQNKLIFGGHHDWKV